MKKLFLSLFLTLALAGIAGAQPVNGLIFADTAGVMVVKVWGTHQERGYALGYLTGDRITDVIQNYVKSSFGAYYTLARNTVIQGDDLTIPTDYDTEAQSVIDGMNASGTNTANLDKTDILVGNTFLDISNLLLLNMGMNCSALMSWNDATAGTDLDGKAVVTRHLDWQISAILNRNHMVTVHFPSGSDESDWLMVGFSGMMGVLSGFSPNLGVFQNMMDDYSSPGLHNKHYLPIWFALRKAIEAADYNGDGNQDVLDMRSVLDDCTNGFSDGYIISALARNNPVDSLVAMVAEITSTAPMHTYRSSAFADSIPGDNLYTANYQIARNNMMHFCSRYDGVRNHIGDGTMIGSDTSWNLMKDWSHLTTNTQFMQFAPEADLFRISVYRNSQAAYKNDPVTFSLAELFNDPVAGTEEITRNSPAICRYNTASETIEVRSGAPIRRVEVFDITGRQIACVVARGETKVDLPVAGIRGVICLVRVSTQTSTGVYKVTVSGL